MERRSFLQWLLGSALLACRAPLAWSAEPKSGKKAVASGKKGRKTPNPKLRHVETADNGVTLTFGLDHAPFPCAGRSYTDNTVVVFVPATYRVPRERRVDVVLHFHGHHNTTANAMRTMQLREQLVDSKQNAILVLPQGPVNAADSSGGKLSAPGGLLRFLSEVRRELQSEAVGRALGRSAIPKAARVGNLILSAHSGGYLVAGHCVERGGFDVREVYLFDALYGEREAFHDWVVARKDAGSSERHKLISYYTRDGGTLEENRALMASLKRAGVHVLHEEVEGTLTREQLVRGTAIFIRTAEQHGTATWKGNALRDCLFASCLRRFQQTDWFDDHTRPRTLERRE